MKIVYTVHALKKFRDLAEFGIEVRKYKISTTIRDPKYRSKDNGNTISVSEFDKEHNIRVVYKTENHGIIIITFYIYRKGRYGEY